MAANSIRQRAKHRGRGRDQDRTGDPDERDHEQQLSRPAAAVRQQQNLCCGWFSSSVFRLYVGGPTTAPK
jgi:hypothetical protein